MQDEAQFEAVYREHCGVVRSFVHRRVPADRADEIVAEVFLAAWRRWDDAPSLTASRPQRYEPPSLALNIALRRPTPSCARLSR
jgi:DNA-directed RNA polymerase specialized sigma24 family protein